MDPYTGLSLTLLLFILRTLYACVDVDRYYPHNKKVSSGTVTLTTTFQHIYKYNQELPKFIYNEVDITKLNQGIVKEHLSIEVAVNIGTKDSGTIVFLDNSGQFWRITIDRSNKPYDPYSCPPRPTRPTPMTPRPGCSPEKPICQPNETTSSTESTSFPFQSLQTANSPPLFSETMSNITEPSETPMSITSSIFTSAPVPAVSSETQLNPNMPTTAFSQTPANSSEIFANLETSTNPSVPHSSERPENSSKTQETLTSLPVSQSPQLPEGTYETLETSTSPSVSQFPQYPEVTSETPETSTGLSVSQSFQRPESTSETLETTTSPLVSQSSQRSEDTSETPKTSTGPSVLQLSQTPEFSSKTPETSTSPSVSQFSQHPEDSSEAPKTSTISSGSQFSQHPEGSSNKTPEASTSPSGSSSKPPGSSETLTISSAFPSSIHPEGSSETPTVQEMLTTPSVSHFSEHSEGPFNTPTIPETSTVLTISQFSKHPENSSNTPIAQEMSTNPPISVSSKTPAHSETSTHLSVAPVSERPEMSAIPLVSPSIESQEASSKPPTSFSESPTGPEIPTIPSEFFQHPAAISEIPAVPQTALNISESQSSEHKEDVSETPRSPEILSTPFSPMTPVSSSKRPENLASPTVSPETTTSTKSPITSLLTPPIYPFDIPVLPEASTPSKVTVGTKPYVEKTPQMTQTTPSNISQSTESTPKASNNLYIRKFDMLIATVMDQTGEWWYLYVQALKRPGRLFREEYVQKNPLQLKIKLEEGIKRKPLVDLHGHRWTLDIDITRAENASYPLLFAENSLLNLDVYFDLDFGINRANESYMPRILLTQNNALPILFKPRGPYEGLISVIEGMTNVVVGEVSHQVVKTPDGRFWNIALQITEAVPNVKEVLETEWDTTVINIELNSSGEWQGFIEDSKERFWFVDIVYVLVAPQQVTLELDNSILNVYLDLSLL